MWQAKASSEQQWAALEAEHLAATQREASAWSEALNAADERAVETAQMLSKSRSLLRAGRTRIEVEPSEPGGGPGGAGGSSPQYHMINGRQVSVQREPDEPPPGAAR